MPPWRIQHESHTCSEQSLRILMWNASYVQKHSIKPDRKSMKTRSEKNLEVCISTSLLDANRSLPDIKFGLKIVWKRHAGSWLSRLPLTKNWKIAGTFSQEHCSVFVGRWLQCSPAASITIPCLSRGFTSIQMFHTHTPSSGKVGKLRSGQWNENEVKLKGNEDEVRWKWDESYLTRTRRGERKRRGKEQTPTQANLAQSGQTLKGQGKRKADADGHRTRPAEGGKDGSA